MHPFTIIREPEVSVEVKETNSVSEMERERLEGTSMNVVKECLHSVKLNRSVLIALSLERDMTEAERLDERMTGIVSGISEVLDVSVYPERRREVVRVVLCTLSSLSPSNARCKAPVFNDWHG